MLVFDLKTRCRQLLIGACVVSFGLTGVPPLGLAAEVSPQAPHAVTVGDTWLAQSRWGRRGGGRARWGGGGRTRPSVSGRPSRPRPGSGSGVLIRPAPGFDRGNRRPSGGWVNTIPSRRPQLRPGLGRPILPSGTRPGRPNWNRPAWNRPGWNRPSWILGRPLPSYPIRSRPAWWGRGWATARPWRYGWYRPYRWGWWSGSSTAWGITSLAAATIIAAAINEAVNNDSPTIAVTDSPYQLVYGSVAPIGSDGVRFTFLYEGESYEGRAECTSGMLNGRSPENPEEAQLLNAACQVAFGSA